MSEKPNTMLSGPPEPWHSSDVVEPAVGNDEAASGIPEEESRLFYERLAQTGQLVDVDANSDLSRLSPEVTHIRHPNGTVERVAFAAPSFGID